MASSFLPPERLLLGPGPCNTPREVLKALGRPTIGHLDPAFLDLMNQVRDRLRTLFGTRNELTIPISATGSGGMQAVLSNLIEPGDRVLVGVHGVFGKRFADCARRLGAEVVEVECTWGGTLDLSALSAAAEGRFKLVGAVHAETSTGVLLSPSCLGGLREIADRTGALLVLDTVTSLAGMPVELDERGVDATWSGTQKCLACPPGLSPISLSPRALEVLEARSTPVTSWYFDLSAISKYWGAERAYHHTAPINMIYGIHEAMGLALSEGMDERFERHTKAAKHLCAGLEERGLTLLVQESDRLAPLTSVRIPDGVEDAAFRERLLEEHGIEIGGGLGPLAGQIWRIGLMGENATKATAERFLHAYDALSR
ncbi:MAG: alanine--glyoxylate aminotransferase family protein [Planctomycetota bacterium]|nr:alanine--glyoxylate aminotransferase family protein [Planctomycetota bacterium]